MQSMRFGIALCVIVFLNGAAVAQPPDNDTCDAATVISENFLYSGTTVGASLSMYNPCGVYDDKDVFYAMSVSPGAYLTATLSEGSVGMTMTVLDSCYGETVACAPHIPAGTSETLEFRKSMSPEQDQFLIRVASENGTEGTFKLIIGFSVDPPNDLCGHAQTVQPVTGGDTYNASNSEFFLPCDPAELADVWYKASLTAQGSYEFTLTSQQNASFTILGQCTSDLLECVNAVGAGETESLRFTPSATGEYYILVAGARDVDSPFVLTFRQRDVIDLSVPYAAVQSYLNNSTNDLDNNGLCDLSELECFSTLLADPPSAWYSTIFHINRARAAVELGPTAMSLLPDGDALLAAWMMLGKEALVVQLLNVCPTCAGNHDRSQFDLSFNSGVIELASSCNFDACPLATEGEGSVEGEGAAGIDVDFGPIYAELGFGGENTDFDGDGVCDVSELDCFAGMLAHPPLPSLVSVFQNNAAQAASEAGPAMLAEYPNIDLLLAAWMMLNKDSDVGFIVNNYDGFQPKHHQENFDLSLNTAIAAAKASCNISTGCEGEGEGAEDGRQSADQNADFVIELAELLRVIQFYNSLGYHCATSGDGSEDGFLAGAGDNHDCAPYDTDYQVQDWVISLAELLRVVQFYNSLGYHYCPSDATEDGFCPGPAASG